VNGVLDSAALKMLPAGVRRPDYDVAALQCGIVHLGVGAFHRAHQAVYTEEAIRQGGGNWGIIGVALRHAAVPDALTRQDNLYTVETLADAPDYRIVAVLRRAMSATTQRAGVLDVLASPTTHIVTLTVTEQGYCLGFNGELDLTHPDIAADLQHPSQPTSAIGWLAAALSARYETHQTPLTIISCDNLKRNGARLGNAVSTFLERSQPKAAGWLRQNVRFPQTVVDCIVPAASETSRARVARVLGVEDAVPVQREPYSQWVIEKRFAGPRPAWEQAGVQIVADTGDYGRLKLHVLNTCHSALAYLGLKRGYSLVREAIADPELARFLEEMVHTEIAPALRPLQTLEYWKSVRVRFQNRHIDHRLAQIAQDGAQKLAERVFPLIIANARAGTPIAHLSRIVSAWLAHSRAPLETALDDPNLFPPGIRMSDVARAAITASAP
jgi:fructuronate reductase